MININLEHCNGCGACVEVCPASALYLVDGKAVVDEALCRECEACVAACPTGAIVLTEQAQELTPVPTRAPAVRPAPQVIQVKTEPAPVSLRAKVLPVVGATLIWAGRDLAPRLVYYFLDSLDRRAAQRQATTSVGQHVPSTNAQTERRGGGRRHRRRRRGN